MTKNDRRSDEPGSMAETWGMLLPWAIGSICLHAAVLPRFDGGAGRFPVCMGGLA